MHHEQGRANDKDAFYTYIHYGTVVVGNLRVKGKLRVHGTIQGSLEVEDVLEIAESGIVEGESIRAKSVIILGQVRASIEAEERVELWQQGSLEGSVRAKVLDIEEGARFTGSSDMRFNFDTLPDAEASDQKDLIESLQAELV